MHLIPDFLPSCPLRAPRIFLEDFASQSTLDVGDNKKNRLDVGDKRREDPAKDE